MTTAKYLACGTVSHERDSPKINYCYETFLARRHIMG